MPRTNAIPDWYTQDWTPANSGRELPAMTWEAVEDLVTTSTLPSPCKDRARALFRALWMDSASLPPMVLLQRFLIAGSQAFDPGRGRGSRIPMITTSATGPLPRWSFTDLEVALSYTWSRTALFIATERHHDLLDRRGEPLSARETVRQVVLLVAGLPMPKASVVRVQARAVGERTLVAA